MKRRWKQTAGFTLVKLIVVIAILGVLAGVAVPTYSGYVKKANMAADQTLASDIATAMQLQYYADPTNTTGGFVILNHDVACGRRVWPECFAGSLWRQLAGNCKVEV